MSASELIHGKIEALRNRLAAAPIEKLPIMEAMGRVLAQDLLAFRDSPSIDVSAMDGYALRIADVGSAPLPVSATITAGSPPRDLEAGTAIRIFTGGPVPPQAQCVVRREDCEESASEVRILLSSAALQLGDNIRRRGENAKSGDMILRAGTVLDPTRIAGAVTFSEQSSVSVHRPVRIAIINTGDELIEAGQPVADWQIRDSNGPLLQAFLANKRWAQVRREKVIDRPERIEQAIADHLPTSDAILLTGGVSMGDTDFVPQAIVNQGGEVLFHRLPIRPGKPILGAVGPLGQLMMGLPGNPVSVAVTFRRYASLLLDHIAGMVVGEKPLRVSMKRADSKTLDLVWFRLVTAQTDGSVALVAMQGSGDIAGLAQSDGFVEIEPGQISGDMCPFYRWS